MTAKRCWDCGTTFYSDYGAVRCNVCHQGRETRKHNDQRALEAQREAQWQAEQDRAAQARHTQALINAENARIAAINYQTQIIMESAITEKQAYDNGYKYIDSDYIYGNPIGLNLCVFVNGEIHCDYEEEYVTPKLRLSFRKGLGDRVTNLFPPSKIRNEVLASAHRVGKQNAEGTFSDHFRLYTGVSLNGNAFSTYDSFKSHFKKEVDEETGELKMTWKEPFNDPPDPELNKAYQAGASEVYWAENTEERKNYRLRVEVPELKAERIIAKETKRWNKIFKVLVYVIPIMFFLLMWQVTSSWVLYGMFIVAIVMRNGLEMLHEKWAENNSNYLR